MKPRQTAASFAFDGPYSFRAFLAEHLKLVDFQDANGRWFDADADRASVRLCGAHDLAHPFGRTDIAGVDAQARGARVGGFQRAFIVKMNVGDDRDARGAYDLAQRGGRIGVGTGHADQVGARLFAPANLVDRRHRIAGQRVGHRLDADRRAAADGDVADHDLAALAPRDVAPGAQAGVVIAHRFGLDRLGERERTGPLFNRPARAWQSFTGALRCDVKATLATPNGQVAQFSIVHRRKLGTFPLFVAAGPGAKRCERVRQGGTIQGI